MGAGYYDGRVLANRQYLLVWLLCQRLQDVNFQVDGLTSDKAYAVGQGLQFFASIQPYWVGDLWARDKELVDFQLADSPTGSNLSPSLRQDAQVPLLREWCMVGVLM